VTESLDTTAIAVALMGDAVATNVFLLGYPCRSPDALR